MPGLVGREMPSCSSSSHSCHRLPALSGSRPSTSQAPRGSLARPRRSKAALLCLAVLSKDISTDGGNSNARDRPASNAASQQVSPPLADPQLASKLNQLLHSGPSSTSTDERTVLHSPASATARTTQPRSSQAAGSSAAAVATLPPRGSSLEGPSAGPGTCWFFAYGTSLHRDALYDSEDVKVLSRDQAFVRDTNMRLVFRHKGGQATLMNMQGQAPPLFSPPDSHVHGVLYKVEESEMRKIMSARWGYELKEVEVQTYAGHAVRSWVLMSSRMALLPREVPPTESYMRQLRDGAADQVLDPAYQAWLSSIETVPCAGLPLDYYNTPSKYAAYLAVAIGVAAAFAVFLSQL